MSPRLDRGLIKINLYRKEMIMVRPITTDEVDVLEDEVLIFLNTLVADRSLAIPRGYVDDLACDIVNVLSRHGINIEEKRS